MAQSRASSVPMDLSAATGSMVSNVREMLRRWPPANAPVGIDHGNAHSAIGDVMATVGIAKLIANKLLMFGKLACYH